MSEDDSSKAKKFTLDDISGSSKDFRDLKPSSLSVPSFNDSVVFPDTAEDDSVFNFNQENEFTEGVSCPLFCELQKLYIDDNSLTPEWREMARWVKYEEIVESNGIRWSKPHVASLSYRALQELKAYLENGVVKLGFNAGNTDDIWDALKQDLVGENICSWEEAEVAIDFLDHSPHVHQHQVLKSQRTLSRSPTSISFEGENGTLEDTPQIPRKLGKTRKEHESFPHLSHSHGHHSSTNPSTPTPSSPALGHKTPTVTKTTSKRFARKIPKNAEGATLLVGSDTTIQRPITALIRLENSIHLSGFCEVNVPIRFIFVLLGPTSGAPVINEIGRCMGALLASKEFGDIAYCAKLKSHLIKGVDKFLDDATVLPPSGWDHTIRIEPPAQISNTTWSASLGQAPVEEKYEDDHDMIRRTGRLFGGLIQDVKRKASFYVSDFKDAIHIQTVAAMVFAYFASLSTTITFGGMMGSAIDDHMASIESLVSAAICGVMYALLAGQPLTILGATGPILVFETILYNFSTDNGWEFMSFRFWVGMWASLLLMLCVMFDLSALVSYITRFTEESFAVLIGLIFIVEAFKNVAKIAEKQPVHSHWHVKHMTEEQVEQFFEFEYSCKCNSTQKAMQLYMKTLGGNTTKMANATEPSYNPSGGYYDIPVAKCEEFNGTLIGKGCHVPHYVPDVFFFSAILFVAVFAIAWGLKMLRTTRFFPTMVRQVLNDFAVPIAIAIVTGIDIAVDLDTPKLGIPSDFRPTRLDRGWIISPFGNNPWWTCLAASLPACLLAILVYMDQMITAVIVNNRKYKLKKGPGYHLDLFLISIQMAVCSMLGTPYFVAATVRSINHIQSLGKESAEAAPGEKPKFLGTREQRVTHLVAFILIGLSTLMAPILQKVPMPVLYGVFLYMGVGSLKGVELMDRLLLVLMPPKYQPDYSYLRQVPTRRVHLFTFIQFLFLVIMWVVKSIKKISIAFPLMVLALCFVRKLLDFVFTQNELRALDDILPEIGRKKTPKRLLSEESAGEKEMMLLDKEAKKKIHEEDENENSKVA